MLFGEHGADEADLGDAVGEDPDDVGAPPDLLVESFLGLFDQIWRHICLGNAVNASRSARAASRCSAAEDLSQRARACPQLPRHGPIKVSTELPTRSAQP